MPSWRRRRAWPGNIFEDGSVASAARRWKRCSTFWRAAKSRHDVPRRARPPTVSTRDLLASDWYRRRLRAKQSRDVALWTRHVAALTDIPELASRLEEARRNWLAVGSPAYLEELEGTIGADPSAGHPWLSRSAERLTKTT